jgi:hypothetical protein
VRKRKYSRQRGATVVRGKLLETVLNGLRVGLPLKVACDVAMVNQTTMSRAMRNSSLLREQVEAAQGELMRSMAGRVVVAAQNGIWQASCWMLERKWPEYFSRCERQEISGPGGTPLALAPVSQAKYVQAVRRALGFWDDGVKPPCTPEVLVQGTPPPPRKRAGEIVDVQAVITDTAESTPPAT